MKQDYRHIIMQASSRKGRKGGLTRGFERKNSRKVIRFFSTIQDSNYLAKGKLQSKWDGPYTVHDVSPTGGVTIMDINGNVLMVNGQRLKLFIEQDKFRIQYIDTYDFMEEKVCHHIADP